MERRLAACDAAAAAAGPAGGALRLVVVFGKGNHSEGGRARLRPAVVALLRRARPAGCVLEGEPNAGCATVVVAPPPPGGRLQQARL